jgi:DNA-binding NarL/FixJ family response regulator
MAASLPQTALIVASHMLTYESELPEPSERLTFVVADTNARFSNSLSASLEPEGLDLVASVDTASDVVRVVEEHRPDVLLVDSALPGRNLGAIARVARRFPATTIVVMGVATDPAGALAALERGASGYLSKWMRPGELAKTLRAACEGEPAVPRSMLPALISRVRTQSPRRVLLVEGTVELTVRERDVAELMRAGAGTGEMADQLGVSPVTVRRHVSSLLRKLGAPDRESAVRLLEAR